MEKGCNGSGGGGGGVKVTFIETQFVTSDATGFKSLVQRLTGNDAGVAPAPDPPPPEAAAVPGRRVERSRRRRRERDGGGGAPPPPAPWVDEMMLYETCDLAEMFCGVDVGASGGGYGGFPC